MLELIFLNQTLNQSKRNKKRIKTVKNHGRIKPCIAFKFWYYVDPYGKKPTIAQWSEGVTKPFWPYS